MVGSNTVTPDNSIHHIYYNRPIMTILGRLGVSQPPRMQEMEWRMDLRGSTSMVGSTSTISVNLRSPDNTRTGALVVSTFAFAC
jgi:hypothetical protein